MRRVPGDELECSRRTDYNAEAASAVENDISYPHRRE